MNSINIEYGIHAHEAQSTGLQKHMLPLIERSAQQQATRFIVWEEECKTESNREAAPCISIFR